MRLKNNLMVLLCGVVVVAAVGVYWLKYKRVADGDPVHFIILTAICFGVAGAWEAGKQAYKRRRDAQRGHKGDHEA